MTVALRLILIFIGLAASLFSSTKFLAILNWFFRQTSESFFQENGMMFINVAMKILFVFIYVLTPFLTIG